MSEVFRKRYFQKEYEFPYGESAVTFVQLIDGSKIARDCEEGKYCWIYYKKDDSTDCSIEILDMTEEEWNEIDYADVLQDIAEANQCGMYPEVSGEIRAILHHRSIRRDVVFLLNQLDETLIKKNAGIVYLISRDAITRWRQGEEQQIAICEAINEFLRPMNPSVS